MSSSVLVVASLSKATIKSGFTGGDLHAVHAVFHRVLLRPH